MYSSGPLFPALIDEDCFHAAVKAAVRGKRRRPDVAAFLLHRESRTASLLSLLRRQIWEPQGFALLHLRDPKPRVIARSPIDDRIVHTAVVRLLEPVFLRSATDDTFACRKGLGTHRAVLRLAEHMRRRRFVVHLDIRSYFPSIDLEILRSLLARRVNDPRFLAVVDLILQSGRCLYDSPHARRYARIAPDWPPPGRGLPIGALTSQLFAGQIYLQDLDHCIKRVWKIPGYVRYMDDFYLFADRRADLRRARDAVSQWLWTERHVRLKHPRARILSCAGQLDALGLRISRDGITDIGKKARRRFQAMVARYAWNRPRFPGHFSLRESIVSQVGHALFGC